MMGTDQSVGRRGRRVALPALLGALALLLAVLAACSADSPCALGGMGWCENGMAALAVQRAAAQGARTIAVVEQDFIVNPTRYGTAVRPLKPDAVAAYIAGRAADVDAISAVVGDVQVTSSPGPGTVAAQGTATVTYYQGDRLLRSETVHGQLAGGAWALSRS